MPEHAEPRQEHYNMLSIALAARNDNYGGAFLERMCLSLRTFGAMCSRHRLDTEVVIVEWNPPTDRPRLALVMDRIPGLQVRIITVPPGIHKMIPGADRMCMFEYVSKNVGIRHARGEHILVSNPDVILSEALIKRFATIEWQQDAFYRANRHDMTRGIDLGNSPDETLSICAANVREIYYGREAGGDFILMSKANWLMLHGHPEFTSYSDIDSYTIELAKHEGLTEITFEEPIYHQDHDRSDRVGRPQIGWLGELLGKKNEGEWGLNDMTLEETNLDKSSISILVPTRKRPTELRRMVESVRKTSQKVVEIVAYCDDDDPEQAEVCKELNIKFVVGPRIMLTDCWNKCIPLATGDIFLQGNDDMVFRTQGWDRMVEAAFAACPDHILMVHGHDVPGFGHGESFGPFPFVHRRWTEILGYFVAPFFSSDYGDAWTNNLADRIGRRRCLPFEVEHMHFSDPYKKAPLDETYKERLERHDRDNVQEIYAKMEPRRVSDAKKLADNLTDAPALNNLPIASGVVPYVYPPSVRVSAAGNPNRPKCPNCGSAAVGIAGGMRHCNQCSFRFI
jgi:hypothetical protein